MMIHLGFLGGGAPAVAAARLSVTMTAPDPCRMASRPCRRRDSY